MVQDQLTIGIDCQVGQQAFCFFLKTADHLFLDQPVYGQGQPQPLPQQ